MKLNTRNIKKAKGMTLLELTVVILVLLSLISILFIGARAWKKGSDRSANILNVRNVQQAVRGHANMQGLEPVGDGTEESVVTTGDDANANLLDTVIFDQFNYLQRPTPPASSGQPNYTWYNAVPPVGTTYITNADLTTTDGEYFYSDAEIAAGKITDW